MAPVDNPPFSLGDGYTCTADDLSGCWDSQTVSFCYDAWCDVEKGLCYFTHMECPQNCPDRCEVNTVVSGCSCICWTKDCPISGYVCNSSDGCCKE